MGVDWYTCQNCGNAFHDAGHYGHCSNCEEMYCGKCYDKFARKYGEIDEDHERYSWYGEALKECDWCNGTKVDADELLDFALKKLNLTEQELKDEYVLMKYGK